MSQPAQHVKPLPRPAIECQVHQEYPWHRSESRRVLVLVLPNGQKIVWFLDDCRQVDAPNVGSPS